MELHKLRKEQLNGRGDIQLSPFSNDELQVTISERENSTNQNFIEANTSPISIGEIRDKHIIPVFVKDNEPCISQVEFIDATIEAATGSLNQPIANLSLRVSHPIKGRSYEARNKKASELLEHEQTIYNERMAFIFEIPHFKENLFGQELTLTVAGVKAYNQDNLYSYGGSLQKFKVGIGYKVQVCTNLCLFTDGVALEIKARNFEELQLAIMDLFQTQSFFQFIPSLELLGDYKLTEKQFATMLGKARLYNHLPKELKKDIPPLLISDSQVSSVAKAYYKNESFMKNTDGSISLWNMYNLFTDATKSSYIDSFLDRNVNAFSFASGIKEAIDRKGDYQWFLN